jgi:LuxR family quorum-sensing system transcriptional regulator CciR
MKYLMQTAEQFADRAATSESMTELTGHVDAVTRDLGFWYWALVHHVSLVRPSPRLIETSNYPDIWAETIHRGQFVDDPVLLKSQRTLLAFPWSGIDGLTDRQRTILEGSRREGIGEGLTVPAHVPGEPNGSCSFATRAGIAMPARNRMMVAQLIGAHAFERARQFHGYPADARAVPHLSPREQEVLHWIAAGKTDPEIAAILGVGMPTVRTYVGALLRKFDVVSRTLLPLRAVQLGVMGFHDVRW